MLIAVDGSCPITYSVVRYLYVSFSRIITSVGEERANFSAIVYVYLCGFGLEEFFSLPLCAWDRLPVLL